MLRESFAQRANLALKRTFRRNNINCFKINLDVIDWRNRLEREKVQLIVTKLTDDMVACLLDENDVTSRKRIERIEV